MIAFVWIVNFFANHAAAGPDIPTIVVHDKRVLCANSAAQNHGICLGMRQVEAKSILFDAVFIPYSPDDYADLTEKWLQVCLRVSLRIETAAQNQAYLDLTGHPDPEWVMLGLQRDLRTELSCDAHIAIARSKWLAKMGAEC